MIVRSDAAQLNFSRLSEDDEDVYLPTHSFKTHHLMYYIASPPKRDLSNVPAIAREAAADQIAIDAVSKSMNDRVVRMILTPTFEDHDLMLLKSAVTKTLRGQPAFIRSVQGVLAPPSF